MDDELIAQLGLLLTQTRFARRALEDIERSTATYATFTFTSVIAAGPKFGEPPMFDGALKVYVVNISDLAPGAGFGNFLEGLLGGAGRFIGNIPGGLIGGTVSSFWISAFLPTIESIVQSVERILAMIGFKAPTEPAPAGKPAADVAAGRGTPVEGSNLITRLTAIKVAVDGLTALFLAGSGQPEQAAGTSNLPSTPEGKSWLTVLDSTTALLTVMSRLADGLIIALPVVLGTLASLISRLGGIRLAIAETLQFLLRNVVLLRGALMVTAFDTVAVVARLAASVIGILQSTVDGILSAVFDTIREALLAVFDLAAVLGEAVKTTVDKLLNWLVPTIDTILRDLGNLRVFRVIMHVVRVLPAILPPIFELKTDKSMSAVRKPEFDLLQKAAAMTFPAPVGPGGTGVGSTPAAPPKPPDFHAVLSDPAGRATGALDRIQQVTSDGLRISADNAQAGLRDLGSRLDRAAIAETRLSDATLGQNLAKVRRESTALAENLIVGEQVRPETGLEAIATAYEGWLSGGGMDTLLGKITAHFATKEGQAGPAQRVAEGVMDRPRATVQIDEVVIEVDGPATLREQPAGQPAPAAPEPSGIRDFPDPPDRDHVEQLARWLFDRDQRGAGGRLPIPT